MAAKEKKPALVRQLTKESIDENNEKLVTPEPLQKKRGRRANTDKTKQTPETPATTRGRRKKDDMALGSVSPEEGKQTPQKNRKPFLEKELEDILENATGRNTPLEDRAGVFLSKTRREPEDDTLSVRSLTAFSRTRRGIELDDDVLSLRSLKVRGADDDNLSVRSLPGKPTRKATKKTVSKAKAKVGRPKKPAAISAAAAAAAGKKKAAKTKDTRKTKAIRPKLGPKQRSTMIAKKKVLNAKKAVKRIYKKKAILKESATAAEVKEPIVPAKGSEMVAIKEEVNVVERNGDVAAEPRKRRRLIRDPPVVPNGGVRRKRGRWESGIHFETTQSPDDSSLIIVQPRLGPKCRKTVPDSDIRTSTETNNTIPLESVATTNGSSASSSNATPYFIQAVSNFNALKSQPTAQGDWLVTPSGVVLIQAVPPAQKTEATSPVTTAVAPATVTDKPVSPSGLNGNTVHTPHPSPVSLSSSANLMPFGSHLETSHSLSVSAVVPASLTGSPNASSPSSSSAVAVSEKAELAVTTRLPRIPVAKTVHDLLALKSEIEDQGVAKLFGDKKKHKLETFTKKNASERRASHDGSFGPMPKPMLRRFRSCDRLVTPSPHTILQLGSEPLPLTETLRDIETDSSFSLPFSVNIPPTCLSPPCPLEPEVLIACEPDGSAIKCNLDYDEECDDEKRSGGRTKKYSRSLDSRRSLLASPRRRSHPEPRVINIVTSEDGSRKGLTLVEELRQNLSTTKAAVAAAAAVNSQPEVPYLKSPSPAKTVIIEETPEEHASKCSLLGALGLRSMREADAIEQRKKEQAAASSSSANNMSNYTGTLKTVIKIQRPEKKGNGRMIYKASSSSSTGTENGAVDVDDGHHGSISSPPSKESHESADEDAKNGKVKSLVIPEKASSFSIHPGRMCSDVCTYCFGKFGLLDTPCHIAQLKDSEKRHNILESEVHLTLDSCLCDACFRHVDKKSNGPSLNDKKPSKRKLLVEKQVRCCVENCDLEGQNNVRRKSLLKLKRSLGQKLILDQDKVDKMQPAHLVSLCHRHIYWVDYYMNCGICNKRLTSVNMFRAGPEIVELNAILGRDGIPAMLTEKRFVCKICQCYCSIRLKNKEPSEMNPSQKQFFEDCRRRILLSHGIEVPDSDAEEGEAEKNAKNKTAKKLKPSSTVTTNGDVEMKNGKNVEDFSDVRADFQPLDDDDDEQGFHKCSTTIQFTKDSMELFYELQRPYGNHSSFLRHLLLLEKFFRNGDLVLTRKADPQAVKYINGVQNRLRSYDGTPEISMRPFTMTPVPTPAVSLSPPNPSVQLVSTPPLPSATAAAAAPPPPPPPPLPASQNSPLTQLQSTVHSIGMKPDISITSVGSEPRKLTPKIQENLRALSSHFAKSSSQGQTRAVILNRTVGGQKQSLVQVTTGGKTIHLTLAQFRRIQQMQLRRKQVLENQKKGKSNNGPMSIDSTELSASFPNIPKTLSVSVTKVPSSVDLTLSPSKSD